MPHTDLMYISFYFAASTRQILLLFLKSNMLVNKCSDFLELGFLIFVWVIGKLGLSSVIYSGVETISASIISLNICWSSHLPACLYIFFMLLKHLCSKESLLRTD